MKTRIIILLILVLLLTGCRSARNLSAESIPVATRTDSLYANHIQYDSIYIDHSLSSEYHLNPQNPQKPSASDTLVVKETTSEYRYRILHDTVRVAERDSIPVIREVEVVKTERYTPWIYRASLVIVVTLLVTILLRLWWKSRF